MDNQNWSQIFLFKNSTSIWKCPHSVIWELFGCPCPGFSSQTTTPKLHHDPASHWAPATESWCCNQGKCAPSRRCSEREEQVPKKPQSHVFWDISLTSCDVFDGKIWSFGRKFRVFWGIGVGLVRKSQHFLQEVSTCYKSWKVKFSRKTSV